MTFPAGLLLLLLAAAVFLWWRARSHARQLVEHHATGLAELRAAHEAALHEHARRLQAVLDSMVEGIVVLDAQNHLVLSNRAAAQTFGFPEQAIGRALIEVVRHHEVAALAARLEREPAVLGYELRIEGAPARFLQINAVALRDPAGEANGAVLVFHDITRVRELEGVRQEFVANVSHELRTPLSLIKGATETLRDGIALCTIEQRLRRARPAVEHCGPACGPPDAADRRFAAARETRFRAGGVERAAVAVAARGAGSRRRPNAARARP
ncbi:MAG TPA: PAS domain-containing protein [Opitutus sp.]|nr:PAS domain-containing protein [Opitutus sp.]